jgi:hypothetical protein
MCHLINVVLKYYLKSVGFWPWKLANIFIGILWSTLTITIPFQYLKLTDIKTNSPAFMLNIVMMVLEAKVFLKFFIFRSNRRFVNTIIYCTKLMQKNFSVFNLN